MNFGISTACFYPRLSEHTITELGEKGIKNIEFFANTASEISKDYILNIKAIADSYNMKFVSLHPFTSAFEPFMLFTAYERRFLDGLEYHKSYFEAMNLLGADIFVFHGDRKQSTTPNEFYFERFAKLRDLGKEFGITFAQENVERCRSRSIDFLTEMRAYLNNDLSIVFDNKQAIRADITHEDFIDALGENIVHVHISDHNTNNDCIPIGYGDTDFSNFLSRLSLKGFDRSVIVELYYKKPSDIPLVYNSYNRISTLKY